MRVPKRTLSFAEWVLGRLTSRERAASIVGDLVEIGATKGNRWLWFSIVRVVLAHLWRRPVAFIAAFYAGNRALSVLMKVSYGIHAQHRPPHQFAALVPGVYLLWIAAVYGAIRFGLRDRFAQFVLIAACVLTLALCYWWQPTILIACIAAAVLILGFCVRNRQLLRSVIALPLMAAVGYGGFLLTIFLMMRYWRLVSPVSLGSREFQEHPSIIWVSQLAWVLTAWIMTSTCSVAHRWTIRTPGSSREDADGATT
ncbi:MAG TPA: hypothetical protein VHX20_14395 [Terracidiphilus sp.]|jgi:hypothetical protein|nr:hypothetical protein [Terracidiphilus sp.]